MRSKLIGIVSDQEWDRFIDKFEVWRHIKNITRNSLQSMWGGKEAEHRVCRILSEYFFKRQVRKAIQESNIEFKDIHEKQIEKFRRAVSDPRALDSLL